MDVPNQGDPDDNSKHSANGTSHTSLSKSGEEIPSIWNNNPDVASREMSNTEAAKKSDKNGGFGCFYCNEFYSNDHDRIVHIEHSHPGKLYYPTPADFENRLRPTLSNKITLVS